MRVNIGKKRRDDNRSSPRIKSKFPVTVVCPSDEKYDAQTVDLSQQGLLLEFSRDIQSVEKQDYVIEKDIQKGAIVAVILNSPFLTPGKSESQIGYRVHRIEKISGERFHMALQIESKSGDTLPGFNVINPEHYVISPEMETEYLSILEQMNLQLPEQHSRVIIFTGPEHRVGTSTLSWWLASCISRMSGVNVLYVDANLRPKINSESEEATTGLLEVLLKKQALMDSVIEMGHSSPRLLNSGGENGFLGNEVTETQVETALIEMREHFQYTFIDSLPINLSPLTSMLAKHADGNFLVLESGESDRKVAQAATERLKMTGSKIIGVILNKL